MHSKQTISEETAKEILEFFRNNPRNAFCFVFSEQGNRMCYWRENAPWLEGLTQNIEFTTTQRD